MTGEEKQRFQTALDSHEMQFTTKQIRQLLKYCRLLWTANQTINLTRHTSFETFVARDLVDVTQLSRLLPETQEVLDIGTGGGVPGLTLSIIRPDLEISVCESVGKKAAVLKDMVEQLELPVTVFHDRAENVLEDLRFDCCTARAAGPMWKLLTWLDGKWLHARRLLAFKGPRWVQEVTEAKQRGLTKGLIINPVAKYPLHSTDENADPIDSFIVDVRRSTGN